MASIHTLTEPTDVATSTVAFVRWSVCRKPSIPSGGSVTMLTTPSDIGAMSEAIAVVIPSHAWTPSRSSKPGVGLKGLVTGKTSAVVSPLPMGMPPLMTGYFAWLMPGSVVGVVQLTVCQSAWARGSARRRSRG